MNIEKIKQLIQKYEKGETSLDEERQLREYFQKDEIPKELKSYADSFGYFEAMSGEETFSDFDPFAKIDAESSVKVTPLENHDTTQSTSGSNRALKWSLRIAAGFILLLVGFSAGQFLSDDGDASSEDVAALQQEVQQMKEALMYDGLYQQASAGERLSAVNLSRQMPDNKLDQQITDILIYTMNNDKSVNVRMAAAEALFRFRSESNIQKALVNSLSEQDDPLMQITLIDMLVELKAKGAVNEMNKLLMDSDTRDIVKERLEAGIAELKT